MANRIQEHATFERALKGILADFNGIFVNDLTQLETSILRITAKALNVRITVDAYNCICSPLADGAKQWKDQ